MDKVQCKNCKNLCGHWCDKIDDSPDEDRLRDCDYFDSAENYTKIYVVLTSFVRTSYDDYTHIFKTVEVEIPKDGNEWHVCGESSDQPKQEGK